MVVPRVELRKVNFMIWWQQMNGLSRFWYTFHPNPLPRYHNILQFRVSRILAGTYLHDPPRLPVPIDAERRDRKRYRRQGSSPSTRSLPRDGPRYSAVHWPLFPVYRKSSLSCSWYGEGRGENVALKVQGHPRKAAAIGIVLRTAIHAAPRPRKECNESQGPSMPTPASTRSARSHPPHLG